MVCVSVCVKIGRSDEGKQRDFINGMYYRSEEQWEAGCFLRTKH